MTCLSLIDRIRGLPSDLPAPQDADGRRVVQICDALAQRPRDGEALVPAPQDAALRVELARLVELLGRRSARAIPLATLGRAALADLAGSSSAARAGCEEVERQLAGLGL